MSRDGYFNKHVRRLLYFGIISGTGIAISVPQEGICSSPAEKGVQYRISNTSEWKSVQAPKSVRVGTGDAVIAGPEARAKVVLDDGVELELDPETQIDFSTPRKVALDHGSVLIKLPPGSIESFVIVVGKNSYDLPIQKSDQPRLFKVEFVDQSEGAPRFSTELGAPLTVPPNSRLESINVPSSPKVKRIEVGILGQEPLKPASAPSSSPLEAYGGVGAEFFRIDAQDPSNGTQANLVSGLSPRIDAGVKLLWKQTVFSVGGALTWYQVSPLNLQQSFTKDSGVRTGFFVQGERALIPGLSTSLKIGPQTSLFVRGTSVSTLALESVSIWNSELQFRYEKPVPTLGHVGLMGSFAYLFPATTDFYSIQSGTAFQAMLYYKRSLKAFQKALQANLGFRSAHQDTSLTSQSEKTLLLQIQYSLGIKW